MQRVHSIAALFSGRIVRLARICVLPTCMLSGGLDQSVLGATASLNFKNSWIAISPAWTSRYAFGGSGRIKTDFYFHPYWPDNQVITKRPLLPFEILAVLGPWTASYLPGEIHGTTGSVDNFLIVTRSTGIGSRPVFAVQDFAVGTVNPGPSEIPQKVSITVKANDPWSFGPPELGAMFESNDSGFDCAFSLMSGTAFTAPAEPTHYSEGVEPDPTIMEYTLRVAPGVLNDPDVFWGNPEGAIDLYSIRISSDASQSMGIDLAFGEGTSQFALSYFDSSGSAFDPADLQAVDVIKQQILGAFVDGVVSSDLNDVFGVRFVPIGLDSYTSGFSSTLTVCDVEIPAPATLSVLVCWPYLIKRRRA